MPSPPDLSRRRRRPELMDDPALAPDAHRRALEGLRRLDRAARAERLLWPWLRRAAREGQPLSALDLACGGGEPAVPLLLRARRAGLPLTVTACDLSPTALEHAAARARAAGLTVSGPTPPDAEGPGAVPGAAQRLHLCQADVLAAPPPGRYDVVMCSLFLHHLPDDAAIGLLRQMRERARRLVLVQDLRRSARGWWLAWLASRTLTRSEVVRHDALASVEAAYTASELGFLAGRAGLDSLHADVSERWPQRLLLRWERPG